MLGNSSFLSDLERAIFDTPGRLIPRSVMRNSIYDRSRAKEKPILLTDAIARQLAELSQVELNRFRCSCVAVAEDDGMSWSAEAVSRAINDRFPQYRCFHIKDRVETDQLPAIAQMTGKVALFRMAAKAGLIKDAWFARRWVTLGMSSLLVALGAVRMIVDSFSKTVESGAKESTFSRLGNLEFLIGVAAATTLMAVAGWLEKRKDDDPKSKVKRDLVDSLRKECQTEEYEDLANDLAKKLKTGDFPRVVIIDRYEALDPLSREALTKYLDKYPGSEGAELWVVFEGINGARLTPWILTRKAFPAVASQYVLFDQLLLTVKEKRDLVKALGKDDSAADFATVKAVCSDKPKEQKSLLNLFEIWRKEHAVRPASYGSLEILYLLSLTSTPGNLFLPREFLCSDLLASEDGVLNSILKLLLPGTSLTSEELHIRFAAMLEELPRAVVFEDNSHARVRVAPEAATVLAQHAGKLTLLLPPPGLGHLFWCLFWHDAWKEAPVEAFWMRKIVYHLELADVGVIKDHKLRASAHDKLLDIALSAVDGTLQSCLFHKPLQMLNRAALMMSDTPDIGKRMDDLLTKAWECYVIFGEVDADNANASTLATDEAIEPLATALLRAHALRKSKLHIAPDVSTGGPLLEIFLDSIAAPELQSAGFRYEAMDWLASEHGQPTRDYALARSAWLAFTICPMMERAEGSQIGRALKETTSCLAQRQTELFARLHNTRAASSRIVDLITLSKTLWCQGLLVSFREKAVEWGRNLESMPRLEQEADFRELMEYIEILGRSATAPGRDEQLKQLAQSSLEAVRLADELGRRPSRLSPQCDLLTQALAREICAVALSALLTACHYLNSRHAHRPSEEAVQAIDSVFRSVAGSLSYGFPELRDAEILLSRELSKKVDDLLNLCILLWDIFGLTQLRDLLGLRRVHFFAVCQGLMPHDYTTFRNLTEAVGSAIGRRDFTGLIANCILADCLEPSAELASHYICRAADIALGGNFGEELKRGFALLAIEKAHALDFDLTSFLEKTLEQEVDGDCFLARHFRKCPEDEACGLALRLLNASGKARKADLVPAVRAILTSALESFKTDSVREEFESLLELYRLSDDLRKGLALDLRERLQKWENRKEIWLYAWLLEMLIQQGHDTEKVRDEARNLLNREPKADDYNSYYLLALALIGSSPNLARSQTGTGSAAAYLRTAVEKWERTSSADENARVYMLLSHLYPDESSDYMLQVVKWQGVHLHREHLRRLPDMVRQGKFFLIFQDHFRWMEFWGLQTELEREALSGKLNIAPDKRMKQAAVWKASGAIVPNALTYCGKRIVVSAEFLTIGSLLFREPVSLDDSYAEDRYHVNEVARTNLQKLLALVISLPKLPQSIRELLLSYSDQLYNFSIPQGPGSLAVRAAS